jgi:hypothetical protein
VIRYVPQNKQELNSANKSTNARTADAINSSHLTSPCEGIRYGSRAESIIHPEARKILVAICANQSQSAHVHERDIGTLKETPIRVSLPA